MQSLLVTSNAIFANQIAIAVNYLAATGSCAFFNNFVRNLADYIGNFFSNTIAALLKAGIVAIE